MVIIILGALLIGLAWAYHPRHHKHHKAVVAEFYVNHRKVTHMFLKISQKLPVSVVFKDAQGNVAQVDGLPQWSVDNAALASVQVAADGMSAFLIPSGQVGSLKLQVSADADLGAGVKTILGELPIDLISGEAVTVELTAGAPVDL